MTLTRRCVRLCIVRHGETGWNTERRIQGHVDIALNAVGRSQAEATARGIAGQKFDAIYSSDLIRAMQTAEMLCRVAGLAVQHEPGLRERHYGRMQGMTYEDIQEQDALEAARFRQRDPYSDFGGGETLIAFADRVHATIERLAAAHSGKTLLLVTHGGVLDIVYRRAAGRDLSSPRDFTVPNAALNWVEVGAQGWQLLSWADRRHLEVTLEQSTE
jgi:2,3-bisphosphoglycerate-dependent phosphoglycerate mutase